MASDALCPYLTTKSSAAIVLIMLVPVFQEVNSWSDINHVLLDISMYM